MTDYYYINDLISFFSSRGVIIAVWSLKHSQMIQFGADARHFQASDHKSRQTCCGLVLSFYYFGGVPTVCSPSMRLKFTKTSADSVSFQMLDFFCVRAYQRHFVAVVLVSIVTQLICLPSPRLEWVWSGSINSTFGSDRQGGPYSTAHRMVWILFVFVLCPIYFNSVTQYGLLLFEQLYSIVCYSPVLLHTDTYLIYSLLSTCVCLVGFHSCLLFQLVFILFQQGESLSSSYWLSRFYPASITKTLILDIWKGLHCLVEHLTRPLPLISTNAAFTSQLMFFMYALTFVLYLPCPSLA